MTNFQVDNVNSLTVHNLVDKTCQILLNSAKSTFGFFTPRNLNNKQNLNKQKPWFNHECRMARTNYRRSKRNLMFRRSRNLEENTKRLEKHHKKVLDTSIRTHRQKIRNKINNLKSTNPREYWKIINSGKKKNSPEIPIDILFDYFKTQREMISMIRILIKIITVSGS